MRRSKLETYVDILKVLAQREPSNLTHIVYKANVNGHVLREYLSFLVNQGLIEERVVGKGKVVYANTARGISVLRFFREPLPIMEEDDKILPATRTLSQL
jgi:predicted transcriptional regulator